MDSGTFSISFSAGPSAGFGHARPRVPTLINEGRTVFAQLLDHLPKYQFDKCVRRYGGNHRVRSLPTYEQFLIMAFAQWTYRESSRDIETCLRALGTKLYHSGIREPPARSTLADANEKRDWRIFADFANELTRQASTLYADEPFGAELQQAAYALDSTTIDCVCRCFRGPSSAATPRPSSCIRFLALRGNFPTVVIVTAGKLHDMNILDQLTYEPGAFYILDRGYMDFGRLQRLHQSGAFFVIRSKANFRYRRRYSRPVDKATGLRLDQTVILSTFYAHQSYPEGLRRVGFRDPQSGQRLEFLSNNFTEPTIAQLYRCRWQIELFFKWIKQHLRIRAFYGTSPNAVRIQVWVAISMYVLVAILKKRLGLSLSLYTILQIQSLSLFEKVPISQLFSPTPLPTVEYDPHNQPCLPGLLTGQ